MSSNHVNQQEEDSLHFSMWLSENGDSSPASVERDARACVAELEERVRNFEDTNAKQEAENEILRHQVQEYESKLNGVLNDLGQLRQKAKVCERTCKEEKATRLEKVLRQLEEANADFPVVTQSHDAELEERVRNLEETAQEYDSKLISVLNDVGQLRQKAKGFEQKWKEEKALHQEKATLLDVVSRKLEEAYADLDKVTQGLGAAKARIEKLTRALIRTRQLYEQAEVQMKQVQQDCGMDKIIWDLEKEESARKRNALTSVLELKEDFHNQNQQQKKKKEDRVILTPELNKDLNKQVNETKDINGEVEAKHPSSFWTKCNYCNVHYEYHRVYLNCKLMCPNCYKEFLAIKDAPPPNYKPLSFCSFKQQVQQSSEHLAAIGNSNNTGSQVNASYNPPPILERFLGKIREEAENRDVDGEGYLMMHWRMKKWKLRVRSS